MIFRNLQLIDNENPVDIVIGDGRIKHVSPKSLDEQPDQLQLSFNNAVAFPGLINSHDHLDFNLFPQLGDRIFNNYTEWGSYIHKNYKSEINKVLNIPLTFREQWGVIKNLICGVTTVVNHGERVVNSAPPLNVHEKYYCLHSVGFEKSWRIKLNNPLKLKYPVVIHTGEGKDGAAHAEIDELTRWNLFHKKLVGVHGVAMLTEQAKNFEALVWCPQSNYYLLNRTAPVNELKKNTTVLFGTDSTLTGHWDIWDHIRTARQTKLLNDTDLYHAFNCSPSRIWGTGCRTIAESNPADLIIVRANGASAMDTFYNTRPEDVLLVIQAGEVRLFDAEMAEQLGHRYKANYYRFNINGSSKYIQSNVGNLLKKIRGYYPQAVFPISAN